MHWFKGGKIVCGAPLSVREPWTPIRGLVDCGNCLEPEPTAAAYKALRAKLDRIERLPSTWLKRAKREDHAGAAACAADLKRELKRG